MDGGAGVTDLDRDPGAPTREDGGRPSGTRYLVHLVLTLAGLGLFTTFSVWLGLFLGRTYGSPEVLPAAAWAGMVLLYVMGYFKKDLAGPMARHLDEALFRDRE